MVKGRRGRSTVGCLFSLLLFVAVVYYGIDLVKVYWNYYRLRDEMENAARFAQREAPEDIQRQLVGAIRDLDLPPEARRFVVRRTTSPNTVSISTQYQVVVDLPFKRKVLKLHPQVSVRQ